MSFRTIKTLKSQIRSPLFQHRVYDVILGKILIMKPVWALATATFLAAILKTVRVKAKLQ